MTLYYDGPATLIAPSGSETALTTVITVEAEPDPDGRPLRSLRADGEISEDAWATDMLGDATLRLPFGAEARVVVTHARQHGDVTALTLAGSGPPPGYTSV